jgi:hypothetical protein
MNQPSNKRLRGPSPAMFVACVALFVAMGGATYAVTSIAPHSVRTKQLHNNAVTSPKVRDSSLTGADLATGAVTGANVQDNSLTGGDVDESTLGTVPRAESARPVAYAQVRPDGTVVAAMSSQVTNANVKLVNTSAFCFHGLPFTPHGAVVSVDYGSNGVDGLTDHAEFALGDPYGDCDPGVSNAQAEVATAVAGTFTPIGFYIAFY